MQKCDGTADCPKLATEPDSWDERDCPQPIGCSAFLCKDKQTCLDESQVCDGVADCPMTEVGEGGEEEEDCDGSGLTDCQQGGSEDKTENRNYIICTCVYLDEWSCDDSCIEGSLRCDGRINCQDGRLPAFSLS